MALASIPFVLSLAVAPAQPPHASTDVRGVELASTYDEATCATLDGALADGWERSAIGENAPPLPVDVDCRPQPIVVADCNDPLVSRWVDGMIGTCDMPRPNAHPTLRALRTQDEHRAQRLLAELASQSDSAAPLSIPSPERDVSPALLAADVPTLVPPPSHGLVFFAPPTPLHSISLDGLLRPPRA